MKWHDYILAAVALLAVICATVYANVSAETVNDFQFNAKHFFKHLKAETLKENER